MAESVLPQDAVSQHDANLPQSSGGSPASLLGKKRSASDADIRDDSAPAGSREESAGGEAAAQSSPKKARIGVVVAGGTGELDEDGPTGSASSSPESPQASAKTHSGWNRGITSGGLRTSFAASAKDRLRKPSTPRASEPPAQPPAESPRSAGARDVSSLIMPPADPDFSRRPRRGSTWETRFVDWAVQLMALNKDREGIRDGALLRDAWELWLQNQASIQPVARADALQAAAQAELDPEKLQEMFSRSLELEPKPSQQGAPAGGEQAESSVAAQESRNGVAQESGGATTAPHGNREAGEWVLPPPLAPSDFEIKQKDQRGWEDRFVAWCKRLTEMNGGKIKVDTPRDRNRVAETYLRWVGTIEGLSKTKAATARRAAVHYAQEHSAQLEAIFSGNYSASSEPQALKQGLKSAPPPPEVAVPSPTNGITNGVGETLGAGSVDEEDREYRAKYFPGVDPDEVFCHLCASHGHSAAECPGMKCRFCHDSGHRSFSCPTRVRCTKCRQLGHAKKDCREKLALPPDEMECAFCQSRDHTDASCHELWRSFSLDPSRVRKVRSLPVYCYCCGRQGHYGPVCGLNPQQPKASPWETWSQANCDRYLDPASSEVAIVFRPTPGNGSDARVGTERPDLGKSIVPQRHIIFEEADDDDEAEDFIRPPVQKGPRLGQITFSGSSGSGNRAGARPSRQYNDRSGRPGYTQQPPLPPGPPPPLPPGPPPPLPPQDYQRQGRRNGGRRARGGGRGDF